MGQFSLRISPATIFNMKIILTLFGLFLTASCLPAPEPEHAPEPFGDGSGASDYLISFWGGFGAPEPEPEPEPFGRKKRGVSISQECQDSQCTSNRIVGSTFFGSFQNLHSPSTQPQSPPTRTHDHSHDDEDSDEDFDEDD